MSSTSNEEYVDRGAGDLDRLERLWAPYRMNYIVDKSDTNGSGNTHTNPFVVIPTLSDEDGLIVARGTYVYCVLNLFPYNSGHMMVVPYREEPNLENLTPAESAELMAFAQAAIRVLKTASRPDACNVGFNLGRSAGGSVAQHLHSCGTPATSLPEPGPSWPPPTIPSPAQPPREMLMLSVSGRKPASVVIEPIARTLTRLGLSPNTVTVAGTCITIAIVVTLIPLNHLVWAAIFSAIFSALDMVDGTMARMRGAGTQFGATLDATCDRLTDGALFGAITWWLIYTYHAHPSLIIASFVVLVTSQVISYVKARGEASGFTMVGGLIERPERLILALGGIGLTGLGVPYAIDIALWVLAVGSVYTVIQRLLMAAHSQEATQPSKPPAGAREFPHS